jgi:hypothetical protein
MCQLATERQLSVILLDVTLLSGRARRHPIHSTAWREQETTPPSWPEQETHGLRGR